MHDRTIDLHQHLYLPIPGGPRPARPMAGSRVHIGGSLAIVPVLRSLGADPIRVFAEARIDLALFDDADNMISFAARDRLIEQCVATTGCEHFGLLVGQRSRLSELGLVGLLVKYSYDVRSALQALVRYFHLRAQGAVVTLAWHAGTASLGFEVYERQSGAVDHLIDGSLAFECNILRELCGSDWAPLEVQFAHREPKDTGPLRRFFRSPLSFNAGHNALVFDEAWLDQRLPIDDPRLRELLQEQLNALEAEHGEDLPAQIRSVLRTALLTKHAQADEVAALFSMHSRTMARRLAAHGTSFQALVDEVRYEIARQMLERSALEVRDIAEMLGYADTSALTRAFKRWSGTTPAQWRARPSRNGRPLR